MISPVLTRCRRLGTAVAAVSLLVGGLVAAAPHAPSPAAAPTLAPSVVHAQDAVRLRKPSPIVLSARATAQAGARIRFDGDVVVRARQPRRVKIVELKAGQWRVIARTTSKRNGTFRVRVKAGRAATRLFRAEAPAARGLPALRTRNLRVTVTTKPVSTAGPTIPGGDGYDPAEGLPAGYVGVGDRNDWSYLFDSPPDAVGSRWDPCTVITWTYNPTGQAYDALPDVRRAFAKISGASGLRFQYVGNQGTHRYVGDDRALDDMTELMVVGWADDRQFPALAPDRGGDAVGIGGGIAQYVTGQDVALRMIKGYLTLDNDASVALARGFNGSGWGQVIMHEVLHALGLGHARGADQLMYGVATSRNHQFGAGDLTGMAKVGAAGGCLR